LTGNTTLRFIELSVVSGPYAKDTGKFTGRNRKGLITIHPRWAQGPDHQQRYFDGSGQVTIEGEITPYSLDKGFREPLPVFEYPLI
jgi:hypothetical protein